MSALVLCAAFIAWVRWDNGPLRMKVSRPVYIDEISCLRDWLPYEDCVPENSRPSSLWLGPTITTDGTVVHEDGRREPARGSGAHAIRWDSMTMTVDGPKHFIDFRDMPHGSRYRGPGENVRIDR
jgi:hypothetical protein